MKGEYSTIKELGAGVVAINRDSIESHATFCDKLGGCPFPLASDPDLEVARLYEALDDDGIRSRRVIFIVDENGIIIHKIPWYQPGNVGQFMEIFQSLGLE